MDEVLISAGVQPAICPSMPTTLKRVETSAGRGFAGLWSLASERELTQIGVADADQCRRFTARELAQGFLRCRWEQALTNGGQLRAEDPGVLRDQVIQGGFPHRWGVNEIWRHLR